MSNKRIEEKILDYESNLKRDFIEDLLQSKVLSFSLLIAFLVNEFYFEIKEVQIPLVIAILVQAAYSTLLYKRNQTIRNQILSINLKKKYYLRIIYILSLFTYLHPDMYPSESSYFLIFFIGIIILESIDLFFSKNKKPKFILTENLVLELDENEKVIMKIDLQGLDTIELTNKKINFHKRNHFFYKSIEGIYKGDILKLETHLSNICIEKNINFKFKKE